MKQPARILFIACQVCFDFLAKVVEVNNALFLQVGPLRASAGVCLCTTCGASFHWHGKSENRESILKMQYKNIDKAS